MIRFIVDMDTNETEVSSSGSLSDIVAELGCCVSITYNMMRSNSPKMAELFKQALIFTLHPDMPVWDKEAVPDPQNGVKIVRVQDRAGEGYEQGGAP